MLPFFVLNSISGIGQELDALSHFTVSAHDGKVVLEWTIAEGNTCLGIGILRSADSITFSTIGEIPGICGSNTESVKYSFVDAQPVENGINYYRLQLGLVGDSKIVSISLVTLNANNYQIRPNPIIGEGLLFFENDLRIPHELMIYHADGRVLTNQISDQNYFHIIRNNYSNSIYSFVIFNKITGHILTRGKFLFQ